MTLTHESIQEPLVVKEYFPGGWHGHDREGRPVFLLRCDLSRGRFPLFPLFPRLGQMDAKGLIKSVGEEGLTKLTLHICEEGIKLTEEASHRFFGKLCNGIIAILYIIVFQAKQANIHLDNVTGP